MNVTKGQKAILDVKNTIICCFASNKNQLRGMQTLGKRLLAKLQTMGKTLTRGINIKSIN